ncbi:MAG: hypothetical protein ACP5I3_10000 [Thermoproteus sp.]
MVVEPLLPTMMRHYWVLVIGSLEYMFYEYRKKRDLVPTRLLRLGAFEIDSESTTYYSHNGHDNYILVARLTVAAEIAGSVFSGQGVSMVVQNALVI